MSLQSECCVQRGHDGRGSEESEEHEGRYGRHGDPTAAETHLQSALLPGSPSTGTAHPYRVLQEDKQRSCPSLLLSQLFIFTDGEVWNTKEILDLVKSHVYSHRCVLSSQYLLTSLQTSAVRY